MFDQPDHVIAQIAKKACRRLWQIVGQIDPAFCDDVAQHVQRVTRHVLKRIRVIARGTVHRRCVALAAPDQIRLHANDGIAPAHLAAGHRFQHKCVFSSPRQLEHQRHRRIQISRQTGIDDLVLARAIASGKIVKRRGQCHGRGRSGKVDMDGLQRALINLWPGAQDNIIGIDAVEILRQCLADLIT